MESEGYIVVIAATGGGGHGWIGFEGGQHTNKKHQIQQSSSTMAHESTSRNKQTGSFISSLPGSL